MRRSMISITSGIIRVLLAAAVLSTGVSQSPALRHCHAGGDRPHHHASVLIHGDEEFAPRRCSHDAVETAAVIEAVPHVHLAFLGIEITLPMPAEEDDSHSPVQERAPLLIRVDGNLPQIAPDGCPFVEMTATALPLAPDHVIGMAYRRGMHSQLWRHLPALCDTARHERSGVQLA